MSNILNLWVSALTFRRGALETLRARSDVFLRGFLVLLFAALVYGVALGIRTFVQQSAPPPTREQVTQIALDQFNRNFRGPEDQRAQWEPYATEVAGMIYDISALPPRAGEGTQPIVNGLDAIGSFASAPFTGTFIGWLLFAGLLFQLTSRWLGGRASMGQMLGLTSLAAAPQVIGALVVLLGMVPVVGALAGLLNFILFVWSEAIYVFGMAIAQEFSIWRSLAATALGFVLLFVVFMVLVVVLVMLIAIIAGSLAHAA